MSKTEPTGRLGSALSGHERDDAQVDRGAGSAGGARRGRACRGGREDGEHLLVVLAEVGDVTGTVEVKGGPPTLTLSASAGIVVFGHAVSPQILTSYQATWQGAFATPTTVQVQPRLTLGRSGAWLLHAYGGRSFAGRSVQLQRLNTLTGQWVTLRKVQLDARSAARVVVTLPKGVSHLRVTTSVNQAGAGFLGAISDPIVWRRA